MYPASNSDGFIISEVLYATGKEGKDLSGGSFKQPEQGNGQANLKGATSLFAYLEQIS